MPKLIFHALIALMLVVSCECKDMHVRRMPEEKDIAFKGEVKAAPSQKTKTYVPNEQREIQVHLTSNDEEAKDVQFKILSWEVADGKKGTLDTSSIRLGNNTLAYTPQEPGTHELTLKVAVEGEEGSAQIFHCPIEAPAAEWQVGGQADAAGNIALTITDAPEEWRSESWRITSTRWSRGLQGRITGNITQLQAGENTLPITLQESSLAEPPQVHFTLQGPDSTSQSITLDFREVCIARLEEIYNEGLQTIREHNEAVRQQAATYQGNLTGNDRAEAQRELTRKLEETTRRQAEATTQLALLVNNLNILRTEDTTDLGVLETRRGELQKALDTLTDSLNTLQPMVTQLNASNTGPIDPYHVLLEALQQGTYDASMALHFNSPLLSRDVINKRDPSGHTLLHYATEAEHQEAIALLLGAGAIQDLSPDWQLQGDYEEAGQQLVLSIGDTPGILQQARDPQSQWRITSTTWSEGLEGQLAPNLALQHGENRIPLEINMGTLTEAPTLQVVLQGPDRAFQDITLDLREVCMARLRNKETDLVGQTEGVNAYVQETNDAYILLPETVTDPRVNREKQTEVGTLLGRLEALQTQYERDLEAFSSNLETLDQAQVNTQLPVLEANNNRLKDAIASLKSAQVQLQQQCTSAHEALFKTLENENQETIDILLEDPGLDVNGRDEKGNTLLYRALIRENVGAVRKLIARGIPVSEKHESGLNYLHIVAVKNSDLENIVWEDTDISRLIEPNELDNHRNEIINRHNEMIQILLDGGGDVNAEDNYGNTVLQFAVPNNPRITVVVQTLLDNGAINNMKKPQYPTEYVTLAPPSF